jgi:hypothetical protein
VIGAKLSRQTGRGVNSPPREKSGTHDRPATWWRMARLLGWAATVLAVAWGLQQLDRYARTPQPSLTGELEWVGLPAWLTTRGSEPILRDIGAATGLSGSIDVQDADLCRRVGEGLRSSPWVAEVKRITKQANGRVRIEATYREPFALVEVGGVAYLVDRAAVRLPVRYALSQVEERYWNDWFRITGVSAPTPNEGEAWTGADLATGLHLIEFLKEAIARGEVPFRSSLRAIDVANFKRHEDALDGELRIWTIYPHCYINWGLPPGEEYSMEPPAATKLAMLRTLYADRGQLPDNILDVRWFTGIKIGKLKRG